MHLFMTMLVGSEIAHEHAEALLNCWNQQIIQLTQLIQLIMSHDQLNILDWLEMSCLKIH